MSEQVVGIVSPEFINQEQNKPMGAREFVLRYLKYLPWLAISAAIALIFAYVKIRYSNPIYHIQSSLLINNDQSNPGGKDEKLQELFLFKPSVNMQNEIEILKSRPLIQRVVRDLGLQTFYYNKGNVRSTMLYNDAPISLVIVSMEDSSKGLSFSINMLNDQEFMLNKETSKHHFGDIVKVTNGSCIIFRQLRIRPENFQTKEFNVSYYPLLKAAENIISNLKIVQANELATILTLSFETENIPMGEDILNTIMSVYDSTIVEDKNRISDNTQQFIKKALDTLKIELAHVEGKLSKFMEKNQAYNLDEQSKAYLNLAGESAKTSTEQDVQLRVLNFLTDYISDTQYAHKLVPTDLGIQEPSVAQLINVYNQLQLQRAANLETSTPNNPYIKSFDVSLDEVRRNLKEALGNVKQSYLIAQKKLAQKDQELQGKINAIPGMSMQFVNIGREQKILEDLVSFLLNKQLETSISSASTISNSRVIEPALGNVKPVKPNKNSLYTTYLIIGLVIPVGLITVFELLSDKVNNRVEIERATHAPILGEIGHSEDSKALVVTRNSRRFIAEQFRIIRTNLQYVIGKKEKPIIMVTSSFSGEGKSFISTNIGAVIALAGRKTVIMEFDIRKPKILSSLELKRKLGITNYIIGKATIDEIIIPVEGVENLYVIPCGPIPPNPAELLLDPRLGELMKEVRNNFEVVIMDTAPVGLVSDAITLGQFADCTLYIVRRGHTVRRLLGLIEELYTTKKLPAVSIILNDIKLESGYYGGYYGGYGYYGYGYGHEGGYFEKEAGHTRKSPIRRFRRWWSQWFS